MRPAAFTKHATGALSEAALAAIVLILVAASVAAVVNPNNVLVPSVNAGRYWVDVEDGVFASTTSAHVYGERTDYRVAANCYQAGTLVYAEWVTADATGHAMLTLGPTERWSSGAADCTAEAGYFRNFKWHRVAVTAFNVAD